MKMRKKRQSISSSPSCAASDDLFLLLQLCGYFRSDAEDELGRVTLISSLNRMDVCLQKRNIKDIDDQSAELSSWFLEMEEIISTIYRQIEVFLSCVSVERRRVLQHWQDTLLQEDALGSWAHSLQDLISDYRIQSQMEEDSVENLLHCIQLVYSDDEISNPTRRVRDCLRKTASCLSRECFFSKMYINDMAAAVVGRVIEDVVDNDDRSESRISTRKKQNMSPEPAQVAKIETDNPVFHGESFWEVFQEFISMDPKCPSPHVATILIVGSEGMGKTYVCDQMACRAQPECLVIRPQLPLDLLQVSMGGSEDFLVSIIGFLQGYSGKALILLDNVEHILFSNEDSGAASTGSMNHLSRRCKSLFLYLMYSLKYQLHTNITLLIVATSYVMGLEAEFRCFDRTFYLQPPDEEERRTMFENFFYESSVQCGGSQRDLQTLLSELVDSTLGRSYAEITQYLRQATETLAASTSASFTANRIQALQAVRDRLQSVTPESLRQGSTENYVDIRVFSARELLCSPKPLEHETYQLPLLGDSALFAWKKLESSIIIPLCRSKQLNDLLDEKCVGGQKCLVGGVLLTGEPGSGKSEIAFHCAKHAAQLLPSFKLIEVSCTSLVHKEVGGSEKAVHHLFESARKAAPCLVVLDGIENIAAVRGNDSTTEGTMDRILSTLLVELDGIDESAGLPGGIAVIGITYDAQLVDPAIKRPGRLDRAVKLSIDWL